MTRIRCRSWRTVLALPQGIARHAAAVLVSHQGYKIRTAAWRRIAIRGNVSPNLSHCGRCALPDAQDQYPRLCPVTSLVHRRRTGNRFCSSRLVDALCPDDETGEYLVISRGPDLSCYGVLSRSRKNRTRAEASRCGHAECA